MSFLSKAIMLTTLFIGGKSLATANVAPANTASTPVEYAVGIKAPSVLEKDNFKVKNYTFTTNCKMGVNQVATQILKDLAALDGNIVPGPASIYDNKKNNFAQKRILAWGKELSEAYGGDQMANGTRINYKVRYDAETSKYEIYSITVTKPSASKAKVKPVASPARENVAPPTGGGRTGRTGGTGKGQPTGVIIRVGDYEILKTEKSDTTSKSPTLKITKTYTTDTLSQRHNDGTITYTENVINGDSIRIFNGEDLSKVAAKIAAYYEAVDELLPADAFLNNANYPDKARRETAARLIEYYALELIDINPSGLNSAIQTKTDKKGTTTRTLVAGKNLLIPEAYSGEYKDLKK